MILNIRSTDHANRAARPASPALLAIATSLTNEHRNDEALDALEV